MRVIHLFSAFLLLFPFIQSNDWQVHRLEEFTLDGQPDEWTNIPGQFYRFDQSTNLDAAGTIGKDDLQVTFKTAWDDQGLYFFFDWQDDIWDEHTVGLDSARVQHKGNSMDRMYYYDNLKIVANVNGHRVVIWFAPRENAIQWYSYRAPGDKGHQPRHMPSPQHIIKPEGNGFFLESALDWSLFNLKPADIDEIQLTVILVDSDLPEKSIGYKLESRQVSYISKSRRLELTRN